MNKFERGGSVSAIGLMVGALALIITLTVGTVAYRHGVEAGQYDAAHDSWNNGFRAASQECINAHNGGK